MQELLGLESKGMAGGAGTKYSAKDNYKVKPSKIGYSEALLQDQSQH